MPTIKNPENAEFGFELSKSGADWLLPMATTVVSLSDGIFEGSTFHDNTIEIAGTAAGSVSAYAAIRAEGLRTHVTIDSTGVVGGFFGAVMSGDAARFSNDGAISATGTGLIMSGDKAQAVNSGSIHTDGLAVDMRGGEADRFQNSGDLESDTGLLADGGFQFTNGASGTIITSHDAVRLQSSAGTTSMITNLGTIGSSGGHYAILGGSGDETVVNHGILGGQVDLGAGNDTFDDRGGTTTGAPVFGGAGDDTFIISSDVNLNEFKGQGNDTIKSTISYVLPVNFEQLVLIGKANTDATGNSGANQLTGNAGKNVLDGMAGKDILTGGEGEDTFVFKTGYGKNTVTDFQHGTDHIDLSGWTDITDFSDLKTHLTVSGHDLVIHDGTDSLTLQDVSRHALHAGDVIF